MIKLRSASLSSFAPVIFVLVLLALPVVIQSTYVRHLLILSMLYAVLASNWDLTLGYLGIFNFAHIAFYALSAYMAGVLSKTFGIPVWISILAGTALAISVGVITSLPALRVKGIYVILVTFAFSQLGLHVVMSQSEYTGGSQGLVLIPPIRIGSFEFSQYGRLGYYYLAFLVFVLSTLFLRKMVSSNFGLSIIALRDNEEYALSRGVPRARQVILTFAASAIFTGVAGAVSAFYSGAVSPELLAFSFMSTILSMVLVGGSGTIFGPIIGAFILTFVSEFMVSLGPWRFLIIGALIVAVLRFYPEGLIGAIRQVRRLQPRLMPSTTSEAKAPN